MGAANGCAGPDDWQFGCQFHHPVCRAKVHDATEDQHSDEGLVQRIIDEPQEEEEEAIPQWVLPPGCQLTVMLFGMAGTGKSSLGNLLAGSDVFRAADTTRSVTNLQSLLKFEQPDSSLIILDTIGLGDSSITQDQVCASIKDVAVSAPHGVDMLLYVMRCGRITDDTVSRLVYLTQYLWGDESVLNLYIVITWASRYVQNVEAAEEWLHEQADTDPRFKLIYKLIGENPSRCIFVDIPSLEAGDRWEQEALEKRRMSYDALLQRFCEHPRDRIEPFRHEIFWKKVRDKVEAEERLLAEKKLEVARIQQELRRNFRECMKHNRQDQGYREIISTALSDHPGELIASAPLSEWRQEKKAKDAKAKKGVKAKGKAKHKSSPSPSSLTPLTPLIGAEDTVTFTSLEAATNSNQAPTDAALMEKKLLEDELVRATSGLEIAQNRLDRKVSEIALGLTFDTSFEQQVKQHAIKQQGAFSRDVQDGTSPQSKAHRFLGFGRRLFGGRLTPRTDPEEKMTNLVDCSSQKVATSAQQAPICIIFDWDDTLCPTWWLHKVLEPMLNKRDIGSFREQLLLHVNKVESVLSAARKVAGHVAILTQATEGWVKQSLMYLSASGIDVESRLKSLNIVVHYADLKAASAKMALIGKSSDISVAAKKASMTKILQTHFGDSPKVQWHALSVGDQMAEMIALKEVCKEQQKLMWRRPICKTLKLPAEPMLEELGESLQLITSRLYDLIASSSDVELSLTELTKISNA